ncbi:MAG: efflux transporter outer membrane subunit [Betaproteobacteria bacterium]|nr:efflux transporter outer membrane subunit [Betaproteobacteria bacterium]MCL2886733.1 efflux transporter outer membrane subunit [Betaproteobacteria bacterium]
MRFSFSSTAKLPRGLGPRWRALGLAALLAGCAVGPDYERPAPPPGADLPAFKESGLWQPAAPGLAASEASAPGGGWWKVYGDSQLDALVDEANAANQNLRQTEAQYRQAQALVQGVRANFFPTVGLGASALRGRSIGDGGTTLGNSHAWSLQASWEPDLWGGVRRRVEAADEQAAASAADLAAARLTVQAAVVNNYIQLRLADAQKTLYADTIAGYAKALALTQAQLRAGVATRADVALAQSTLAAAQAQAVDVDLTRRQLEHALAVLLGQAPAAFTLEAAPLAAALPLTPTGLPADLLQRRPDIAAAERRVAAANADIGVAQAAWFPNLLLTASGGYQGSGFGPWFATPDRVWALGAALAATLFDGGARSAQVDAARAAFDAAAANYRQTVLAGFQEVEDNLAALGDLAQEAIAQQEAARAAHVAEQVLLAQYRAGTTTYIAVITAQAQALAADRALLQVRGRQFAASVALIKALGGGWHVDELAEPPASPTPEQSTSNSQR